MDKKRLFLILAFSAFSIAVGFLIYWVFFAPKTTPPRGAGQGGAPSSPGEFPNAGQGGVRTTTDPGVTTLPTSSGGRLGAAGEQDARTDQRVQEPIAGVSLSTSGQVRYYNETDGKMYRLNKDGTLEAMADTVFFSAQQVTWSPVSDKAIIEYPDGSNIFYDFQGKKQVTLPKHWQEFSFAPQGEQIAAKSMALSPENRWLITANPDGQNITLVEPMGGNADKVTVDWSPSKQVLAFSKTGQALGADRQEILLVGQYGENFKSLTVEGRDFKSSWSKTGSKVVYSVYSTRSEYKPELWVVDSSGDAIGGNRKLLNLNTWADKCAFADDRFVFCGVPTALQTGAGFAPQVADAIPDTLYKIDTQTGIKTEIKTPNTYTVDSLTVSPDGSKLYVTDKQQNGLFEVPLL